MNVFEKYLANLKENEELSKIINKLCYAYLVDQNDMSERIRFLRFVKFIKWEFEDVYNPRQIKLTFIEQDTRTKEEKETSIKINWFDLLMKVENYD
jgi:hypothetical protein